MVELNIQHEDVLMKMFMYSLKQDAQEWYFSLPAASISSLKEFHTCFRKHCKYVFSAAFFLKIVVSRLIFIIQFLIQKIMMISIINDSKHVMKKLLF